MKKVFALLLAFAMIFTSFAQISFAENKTTEDYKGLREAIQNRERPAHNRTELSDGMKKAVEDASKKEEERNLDETLRVIVELEEAPVILQAKSSRASDVQAVANRARSRVKNAELRTKSSMRERGIDFKEIYSLDTFVSGFSIFTKRRNLEAIKNIDGVKNVQIAEKYTLPRPEEGKKPQMYASVDMIGAPRVWENNKYKGEGQVVAVLDTGFDVENVESFRLDDESKVALTESKVNELISKYGLKGKYYSPKVPYIYNYQDETAEPDALQDRYGSRHGLHVAGTIAANEAGDYKNPNRVVDQPIKGVAPNAQLIIMKVFSTALTDSSTYSDTQCKAIEDSYKLGADSMNLSLGSPAGFVNNDDIVQVAFQNAIKAGCLVAVANGNEGTAYTDGTLPIKALEGNPDYGMAGTPANGWATTSVAAITNLKTLVYSLESNVEEIKGINFSWGVALNKKKAEFSKFVYAGPGQPEDFAKIKSEDITGALAIVRRGGNSFNEKATNAKNAGAIGLLVINKDEEDLFGMSGLTNLDFPTAIVGKTNGEKILSHITDEGFTLTYMDKESKQDNPNAGKMASFTSWGPTPALTMKPEVTAPGVDIYSIDQDNKYQVMSGTSMATPHVAGAAAIVAQFLKDKDTVFFEEAKDPAARQVLNKTLLMNTAVPQMDTDVNAYYPVRRQGAGLIDLENLVKAKVTAKATSKNDKDLDAKAELKSFTEKEFTISYELRNYSGEDITYKLEPSMMTEKFVVDPDLGSMTTETDRNMDFTTDKKAVVAKANNTTKFNVTFNFENDAINKNNYVEGFLRFIPSDTDKDATLTVPYLGFYGDWGKPRIFDVFSHEWSDTLAPNFLNLETYNAMGDVFDFTNPADGEPKDTKLNQFIYNNNWTYITSHDSSAALRIRFALLRNAEYIKTRIEDEDGNILKDNVVDLTYFRKSRAVSGNGENWINIYKDAFKYNALNNIVLKGKLNTEEENTQEVTLPVYFDDTAPIIKSAEYIDVEGVKYAKITLSDNIGIDTIGVQQIKEVVDNKGNTDYSYHMFNEIGGLYYGNTEFRTEDENRKTVQDEKVIESLKALKGSNEEKTVFIKVDDIDDIEQLAIYAKDIAGNWAEDKIVDTDFAETEKITLKLIEEETAFWVEAGNVDSSLADKGIYLIDKGIYGELQIVLPNDGKNYSIETATVNGEEMKDKFEYNQKARVYYMNYRFDKDTVFSAKISEFTPEPPEPGPEPQYPEGNGYPSIFLIQPGNQWTVSENSPLNPQDDPEIENGNLNVIGAVGFTPLEKLNSITLRFIDDTNKKQIGDDIVLDLANEEEVSVKATGPIESGNEVVYDGLAVFFNKAIPMPEGYNSLKLQVEAVNDDNRKTVTAVTLAVDESPATFNYTIDKRVLMSDQATINFGLSDDNKSTQLYIDRVMEGINKNYGEVIQGSNPEQIDTRKYINYFVETVYSNEYNKWDIDRTDTTRYMYKDKFTVKLYPGFNKFKVTISEGGTARINVRYIMIYMLDPQRNIITMN